MPLRPCRLAAVVAGTLLVASPALAGDVWQAVHLLEPGDILRGDDVVTQASPRTLRDAIPASRAVVGLEVKRRIYAGRTLTDRDVGPRTAVKANSNVEVLWKLGNLTLQLDGRSLESGALGDGIRVLNMNSSRTIYGTVVADGVVEVRSEP